MNFEDKRFSEINKIEIMLNIVDDDDSHLINILYDDAIETFCSLTNRTEEQLYPVHCNVIRDLTIFKFRQYKAITSSPTGIKSISEGGVSISYNTSSDIDEIPPTLKRKIVQYKLNKCVNRRPKKVMFPEEDYPWMDDDDEPSIDPEPVEKQYMYYGRVTAKEAGVTNRYIEFNQLTEDMILNAENVTKTVAKTMGKTSFGLEEVMNAGDYLIIAVPPSKGYTVTKDNGIGGKVPFDETNVTGSANGLPIITIEGKKYLLYGECLLSGAEIFFYID